ncbi:hypothetical protein B5X24_HaOG216503 [Helicoverpa armigera]|uniref:Uncharacterized protein n=1 Tax=Helicoverpa armigera TaxID=29058 RepID=A0A2W1CJL4_HELAM|nr:hypothetical protein B5X24_HaOG216503 [Helicoverpa armigera]
MNFVKVYYLILFYSIFLVASNYRKYILKTPHQFKYEINDVLNMDIIMINIPRSVYHFSVYTDEKNLIYNHAISNWDKCHIKINGIAMQNAHISMHLQLLYSYTSCAIVDIAYGHQNYDYNLPSKKNETDDCLNDKHCTIVVDFQNSCTRTIPYFNCSSIDRLLVCTKQEYNEATFTWQQFYDDGCYIGTAPKITAAISKFIFTVEHFDNNTFVKVSPNHSTSSKITVNPNFIPEEKTISKLTFTDSTDIEFDCDIYLQRSKYVNVGLINTTENKITTLNTTKIYKKYGEVYNGSILCCLYYTTTEKAPEKYVTRFVRNKTLLLYNTEELENNTESIVICIRRIDLIYAASVLGLAILFLVVFLVIKKKYCKKTSPVLVESVECTTFATTDGTVNTAYENSINKTHTNQAESNYAEIIGVLTQNTYENVPKQIKLN